MSDTGIVVAPAPAPAPAPASGAPWYADKITDAETIGYLQNRGWDKDQNAATLGAIKAHREAEKHLGVPVDRRIDLPADPNDAAAMKAVWQKLGAPADKTGYDFSGIKNAAGAPVDARFSDFFAETAAKLNVPKAQAVELLRGLAQFADTSAAAAVADRQAKFETEQADLKKSWGTNYAINENVARLAAERLGLTADDVKTITNTLGFSKTLEVFRKVGAHVREDAWTETPQTNGTGATVMTREAALSRKADLLGDDAWGKDYLAGDTAKIREMTKLNSIITGASE